MQPPPPLPPTSVGGGLPPPPPPHHHNNHQQQHGMLSAHHHHPADSSFSDFVTLVCQSEPGPSSGRISPSKLGGSYYSHATGMYHHHHNPPPPPPMVGSPAALRGGSAGPLGRNDLNGGSPGSPTGGDSSGLVVGGQHHSHQSAVLPGYDGLMAPLHHLTDHHSSHDGKTISKYCFENNSKRHL